jgi:hypothetical protein
MAEDREKSRELAEQDSAGVTIPAGVDRVFPPQNEKLPTLGLPVSGRLIPLRVVPEKRKDVIPDRRSFPDYMWMVMW